MQSTFTDNDIQDYLEGVYTGKVQALEDYLQKTEEGRKRLDYFNAMFRMLGNGPLPTLKIALDEAVLAALDARQQKPARIWNSVLWVVTVLSIAGTLVAGFVLISDLSFFNQFENGLILPFAILLILLLVGFYGLDWYRQYRRYQQTLS